MHYMHTAHIQSTNQSSTAFLAYVLMSGLQFSQAGAVVRRLVSATMYESHFCGHKSNGHSCRTGCVCPCIMCNCPLDNLYFLHFLTPHSVFYYNNWSPCLIGTTSEEAGRADEWAGK